MESRVWKIISMELKKLLSLTHSSLRSGCITSVLLNNSNENTGIVNANLMHAARIGAWSTNNVNDNMVQYLKQSHGHGIAAKLASWVGQWVLYYMCHQRICIQQYYLEIHIVKLLTRLECTTLLTNSFYYFHDIFEAPIYPNSYSMYKLCEYCFEYMHNNTVYDNRELYFRSFHLVFLNNIFRGYHKPFYCSYTQNKTHIIYI